MKAMILAAGRGQRLHPLTQTVPKALVKVGDEPLIVHHLKSLKRQGIDEVVINLAYLGEKIETYLGNGQQFGLNLAYSKEYDGVLETGGGIAKALPLLGEKEVFLCINADIFTDYPFAPNPPSTMAQLAHVLLVPNPTHNPEGDFALEEGKLINSRSQQRFTFAGVAWYQPSCFKDYPNRAFSAATLLREKAGSGLISGEVYHGQWLDVGTPERLSWAQQLCHTRHSNTPALSDPGVNHHISSNWPADPIA